MINLLPQNKRSEILASQSNALLLRYCFATLGLAVLLMLLTGLVYVVLKSSQANTEQRLSQALTQTAQYNEVQREADEFRSNLAVAKTVLNSGTDYSRILIMIAQELPPNVSLASINLSPDSLNSPMSLELSGENELDALNLKSAFEESKIFKDVRIESINKAEQEGEGANNSGVTIRINVTLTPDGLNDGQAK